MTRARNAVFAVLVSLVALGAVVVAADPPAMATPDFVYTAVDVFGASWSKVLGINSVGALAGDYRDAEGTLRGYVIRRGVASDVFYPGAAETEAFGINTRGDVAGTFYDDNAHGFLLVDGTYSEVAIEGATDVYVYDINDSGALVGEYADANGMWFNFVRSASGTTTFTEADMIAQTGDETIAWVAATGFNDRREVVGHLQRAGYHMTGFIYANGVFTEVDYPEANLMSCFFGISDTGQAVGHVRLAADGVIYGSIFKDGQFTALLRYRDAQGTLAPYTYLHAMSPNGLVGGWHISGGKPHAFVARRLAN